MPKKTTSVPIQRVVWVLDPVTGRSIPVLATSLAKAWSKKT
jgi:hypothetical protein